MEELLESLTKNPVISVMLQVLREELAPELLYHSINHTEKVLEEAVLFATHDQLSDRDIELLAIAAAYHDAGYLDSTENNEELGAELAMEAMRESGTYQEREIDLVASMILDTKLDKETMRQSPQTNLSKYLCDADLASVGREDFFEKAELLCSELAAERSSFLKESLALFEQHVWLTDAAKTLRDELKQDNLKKLRKICGG